MLSGVAEVSLAVRHVMQANKSKNTKPELTVRQALRKSGLSGYRLHWKKCAGRPDICYPGRKIAIFVNGCYWHRCPHCNLSLPKSNVDFWKAKFERNKARDARNYESLVADGWAVLIVWECVLRKDRAEMSLSRLVREVELVSAGMRPAGYKIEIGYLKPWQHRQAWKRRQRHRHRAK